MNGVNVFSPVEKAILNESGKQVTGTNIPCITVDNFPKLGLITALRFLEWCLDNPVGVVSLPTGKTPEYFIKWTQYILQNWNKPEAQDILSRYNFPVSKKPDLSELRFVQIDEFYPVYPYQHNSFYNYVINFYLNGFGLDKSKALLINSEEIPLPEQKHFSEIFPDNKVDLSLRTRECRTTTEQLQRDAIFMIDNWCSEYEEKIRQMGGIGFFLGGIGPDGHIAFNTRGSDCFSTSRLTGTNYETQAVAASDLGGIEVSANRLVITIGLQTITYNPEATAIIIAAGEAKAEIVSHSAESKPVNIYPASYLSKLPGSRFYLTNGAASRLQFSINKYFVSGEWNQQKSERAVINLCKELFKYGHHLTVNDLKNDPCCSLIPGLNETTVSSVVNSIESKMLRGMKNEEQQVFLHTGPHHDDIMLGILPYISKHLKEPSNTSHFAVMTSGFTAVTNQFLIDVLKDTLYFLKEEMIQMIKYPDFFDVGYKYKWDKDVYHYLTKVAAGEQYERRRGLCHRVTRSILEIYKVHTREKLREVIVNILNTLSESYDGAKNPPEIQQLKGMIREFEEELVWAHYGIQGSNIHHLRLGFYKGDIFTEQPKIKRDVKPVLDLLRSMSPTVLSLAFDPEGSGPDTHYKVLQTIAEALREWGREDDISELRIWGYRNVWYRFDPSEANIMVPVSLNAMAAMDSLFTNCYLSQADASFPSYELHGKFSELSRKIWVDQLKDIQLLLGKNYFYQSDYPRIRSCHGMLFIREMNIDEFLGEARQLEKSMEGVIG
jgi:glucosamine-6-phosphate deaminase